VRAAWDPNWGNFAADLPQCLHAALGSGLLGFLRVDDSRRLLAKNPSVNHLERFFDFFPNARLLVLVRDSRSVTQSCMDTFGWSFERAARAWASAADAVERFRSSNARHSNRWLVVRYEDVVDDLERHLPPLLQFLGLPGDRYDMIAARNLPVRGSSAFFGAGRSSVHWDPIAKDSTFAPKERWQSWPAERRERFELIAGRQLEALGYPTSGVPRAPRQRAKHLLLDLAGTARLNASRARANLGTLRNVLRRGCG
jgi:hypothetical protein